MYRYNIIVAYQQDIITASLWNADKMQTIFADNSTPSLDKKQPM